MSRHSINLFMWVYQPHFRIEFEHLLDSVLREIGAEEVGGKCLLVGAKMPDAKVAHDVCVEPEDGQWAVSLFAKLPEAISEHIKNHPLKNMYYGDEPSMRDKPENIRRDSVRQAVQDALVPYDAQSNVRSFAGAPAPVDGYYVVPVLQLPNAVFERFRPLREPVTDGRFVGDSSLIHSAVRHVLDEAHDELLRPDPGRYLRGRHASAAEIVKRAASSFMYTPGVAIGDRGYARWNLFERFNLISSLMYEGAEGRGRILLANLDSGAVDVVLALAEPVPFSEPRWARKILQMASLETALLANTESILGLGNIAKGTDPWKTQNLFEVEFLDHYHWRLSCGDEALLVSRYGVPSLPKDKFPRARLLDTFQRLFPESTADHVAAFTALFDAAVEQHHGSMLVVANDAVAEAERLSGQGTKIIPAKLTPELYRRVSNIDGTIIVDPQCVCHAVGVILDGPANEQCTASRGARYNSGIRYVAASRKPRLAVVVSDDRTVDVIPVLRPRIHRGAIEERIATLQESNVDNHHEPIGWLDEHRFYLDQSQCDRVNAEQRRLDALPRGVGELRILRPDFRPDPECTPDYFEPEGGA
ncbi:MAG: hypothetical protein AMXMBFR56_77440 [Polyangiaceae bacterium]